MNRNEHKPISDEQLNAFVDDELDFEERTQLFEQMEQNKALAQQARELRQLRSLLQHTYRNPPLPSHNRIKPRNQTPLKALAAGLLLGIGAISGWYGNTLLSASHQVATDEEHTVRLNSMIAEEGNLLIHISSDDPQRMKAALDYAEEELAIHRDQNREFRLEILTNDGGVELLRRDTSPYPERIAALLGQYENITFIACANALHKLQERGINVKLLPGIESEQTAIDKIVDRLENGWRYLKV